VLAEINQVSVDVRRTHHERYLAIYKLINERDNELASTFNDLRRSTMIQQLARIKSLDLLTSDEFEGFSPETREVVLFLVSR
jgi:hypothetical protein